jgi:hypothetical protein
VGELYFTIIGFCFCINLAETGEVCIIFQDITGGLHGFRIQYSVNIVGILVCEYLFPALYMVLIGPAQGIKTGMGISPDRQEFMDGNICWQFVIDLEKEIRVFRQFSAAIKMRIKDSGMDPGVGPSTTGNLDLLSKQQAEVFIQDLLDSVGVGLDLPAVVIAALE